MVDLSKEPLLPSSQLCRSTTPPPVGSYVPPGKISYGVIHKLRLQYHVSLKPKIRVGFEAKLGNSSSSER